MARAKHDITHSCGGRVDCLGLCAICETVMASINAGVEYSEDGGKCVLAVDIRNTKSVATIETKEGTWYFFDPNEVVIKSEKHTDRKRESQNYEGG